MFRHRHSSHYCQCPPSAHQANRVISCFDIVVAVHLENLHQRTVGLLGCVRSVWVRLCESHCERGQLFLAHPVAGAVVVVPLTKAAAAVLVAVAAAPSMLLEVEPPPGCCHHCYGCCHHSPGCCHYLPLHHLLPLSEPAPLLHFS